jgi:hypothetical protein
MLNHTYTNVNVNGATIQGAEVVKTIKGNISRFYIKNIGVISYLFDAELNLTYIWLHINVINDDDDVRILRVSLNGRATQKAIKHYVKSYLVENNLSTTNALEDTETDKWLNTVIEYVMYQGNTIVIFNDEWFDINILTTQTKTKSGLVRYALLETFVYGEFGDDKLIECLSQINYDLKQTNQEYPSQILAL